MNSTESLDSRLSRFQQRSLLAGAFALALCVLGALRDHSQFFHSYLLAYVFWMGVPLGCMAILMLHHMVGGNWGFVIRRLLESGTGTIPLMAALFLPLLFGLLRFDLYRWSAEKADRHPYLNTPFFIERALVYFAAWILLAYFLNKWSFEQDRTGEHKWMARLQSLSGPGLIVYGLTVTYSSIDWVMSLEPEWFSTVYGMIFMVTQALAAMAFTIVVLMLLADHKPLSEVVSPSHFQDLGNLLLTFVMLWAYLSFAQYLIIWSGNLQDEISWYSTRGSGGWAALALLLIVFHFAVPFLLLLSWDIKRRAKTLGVLAAGLVLISLLDLFWLVAPAFDDQQRGGPHFHWMDWLAPIGIGGLWVRSFIAQLRGKPLLPLHDPRFEGAPDHGH